MPCVLDKFTCLIRGQVRNDNAVDTGLARLTHKCLITESEDRIVIGHQDNGHLRPCARLADKAQNVPKGYSVLQSFFRSPLDDRTVGDRVGKRHAEFHHVGPALLKQFQQLLCSRKRRGASHYVRDEGLSAIGLELLEPSGYPGTHKPSYSSSIPLMAATC